MAMLCSLSKCVLPVALAAVNDLSPADRERFLHVVQESLAVDRHFQLFLWMQGEFQRFLPHDIFIAMVGDFASGSVAIDIVSALPRVRTGNCVKCGLNDVAMRLYQRWQQNQYQLISLTGYLGELLAMEGCECPVAPLLAGAGNMLAHGLRDSRSGEDALYLLIQKEPSFSDRERRMFALLLPQIDFACRRVVALETKDGGCHPAIIDEFALSDREAGILDWVRLGKTNEEIGRILDISAFTVKNHLQRIYRKMNVMNRAQAVAKLEETGFRRQSSGR